MVAGVDEKRNIFILDVWREQRAVDDVAQALVGICQTHKPEVVLHENSPAEKVFRTYVLDYFRRYRIYAPLKEIRTGGQEKEVRAAPIRGYARQGLVSLKKADFNAALLEEVTGFPDVAPNDDIVDCMAILGRYLHAMPPGEGEQAYVAPPPIEGAVRMQDGQMVLTETLDSMFEQRDELINASYSWERI